MYGKSYAFVMCPRDILLVNLPRGYARKFVLGLRGFRKMYSERALGIWWLPPYQFYSILTRNIISKCRLSCRHLSKYILHNIYLGFNVLCDHADGKYCYVRKINFCQNCENINFKCFMLVFYSINKWAIMYSGHSIYHNRWVNKLPILRIYG